MPNKPSEYERQLRTNGLKLTAQRQKVFEVFERNKNRHLGAEDVYRDLMNSGSDIGLGTVYRILMQFVQAGLLSKSFFEPGKALFELNDGTHHDHLICIRCGRVVEFHDAHIEQRQREIAEEHGFELHDHSLALYGLCKGVDCKPSKPQAS